MVLLLKDNLTNMAKCDYIFSHMVCGIHLFSFHTGFVMDGNKKNAYKEKALLKGPPVPLSP